MSRAGVVRSGCLADGSGAERRHVARESRTHAGATLEEVLGTAAWLRLPPAVRARFAHTARAVDYVGEFEVVRASLVGRVIAWACQVIGTPVAPRTGHHVPAIVHVGPSGRGVEWRREYQWSGHAATVVRSTKVIKDDGALVEVLPAHLCMSLHVYEEAGALHFMSRAYYFELPMPWMRRRLSLVLPPWLSPGTTHVRHIDLSGGWFRFSMTVTHPLFGEVFHQTGCFHASGG
jgi:hypothetical protein